MIIRRALFLCGIILWLVGCANEGNGDVGRSDTDADTTKNMTRNVGAAGTGGVGAGYGAGGSTGVDTSTSPGSHVDTSALKRIH